jgi:hypothetical protein
LSIVIVVLLLVGNGAADGGARVAGVVPSPSSSSVLVLIFLISGMSEGISRMSSRALLELRDLARLVSFVEEEPGPKLDIDVSRFEAG